jgi:hypothetical protein
VLRTVVTEHLVDFALHHKLVIGTGGLLSYGTECGIKRMHTSTMSTATAMLATAMLATAMLATAMLATVTTTTLLLRDYTGQLCKSGVQRTDLSLDSSGCIQKRSVGGLHGGHTTGLDHLTIQTGHVGTRATTTLLATAMLTTTVGFATCAFVVFATMMTGHFYKG